MSSILEQSIVHHLNGETEKAQELFHKFVVAKARQIHESMRHGEDPLAEGWDSEITSEEYFTEDDLAGLEDGEEGEEAPAFGGEDGEVSDDVFGGEEGDEVSSEEEPTDDDFGAADDVEGLGGEGDLDDDIADLKAELEALKSQVADLLDGDDADFGDDFGGEDTVGGEEGAAEFDDEPTDGEADAVEDNFDDDMAPADGEEEEVHEGEDADFDDEFDRMTESVIDELAKIEANLEDGKEIGAGKSFEQNRKSGLTSHSAGDRVDQAKPVRTKNTTHSGFERETAPDVSKMKGKRRNVLSKSSDTLSDVKAVKPSDGKEVGSSGKSVTQNRKSPLSGLSK